MKNCTHLTTCFGICVNAWMCWHGVAIKVCLWEFMENWVVVAGNAFDLWQILTFYFLGFFQCAFKSRMILRKNINCHFTFLHSTTFNVCSLNFCLVIWNIFDFTTYIVLNSDCLWKCKQRTKCKKFERHRIANFPHKFSRFHFWSVSLGVWLATDFSKVVLC